MVFMQSIIPAPTLKLVDESANDIEFDKIETLVARVRAIEGVDLYDLI